VIQMVREPVWEHPFTGQLVPSGKNNPLGAALDWILDRWREFYRFSRYTPRKSHRQGQSPTVASGCANRDIKALFEKVKIGTSVIVIAH
jgi:lipoprotein-anchoring transpeptidase ErfK/SrfK